jgi:hypothetical protein
MREFKIQLGEKDIQTVEDEVAQPFLLEPSLEDQATTEAMADATEYFCPYCGQVADSDSWWTQEQLSYAHVAAKNIATEMINRELLRTMRGLGRQFGSRQSAVQLKIRASDIPREPEWISPENNDMAVFALPCCDQTIKIDEAWHGAVHCFFCGFPYRGGQVS